MVIIDLIDFTSPKNEFQIETSSSDHNDNNIQYLFNLLKSTIRNNRYKKFSLQFKVIVDALDNLKTSQNYDVVISERHNILVATQYTSILIYNRIISSQPPIPDKILFKVNFNLGLRCLKLSEEVDGDYLYVSTYDNTILKINFTQLLISKEKSIIWTSETFENLWGIDILNDSVYVIDYNKGIIVLNREDGKTLTDATLPKITKGYQLVFISPTEMIISHNRCVELFHLTKKKWSYWWNTKHYWKSMKKTSFPIQIAYSIFYERDSKLIYLADSSGLVGEKIKVINGEDLSLVKSFGHFNMNFGMCIDRLSGLLYVCDACSYIIKVYQ